VLAVRGVQLRWSGHTLLAEADVEVDPDLTVRQAHDEAHDAQGRLATGVRRLSAATIHISPTGAHPATSSVGDRHAPHS
jgi:divalent metal cation (Fe/Co/Zn/Cd) transporter